ncbi:MAG TPA: DUF4382 domain-containing protein [Candidatus Polarisedimenticolaceae bacterium]|nr:DUF4382 domain-containing protein [Candidatus Polarisedimenticolaceae bacterium]
MRRHAAVSLLLGVLVLTAGMVGCNDSDEVLSGGNSQVRVMLTDAPADQIASAKVTISRVYLVRDDGAPVDLRPASDTPLTFELLDLRNGLTALLADHAVPAAHYNQLRLVVDSAEVTLVDGLTFSDGTSTKTLTVPSGMQTGIKVQLAEPITADEGELTIVTVDFDVADNFVLQGPADAPNGVIFTPVLKEKGRTETAIP